MLKFKAPNVTLNVMVPLQMPEVDRNWLSIIIILRHVRNALNVNVRPFDNRNETW